MMVGDCFFVFFEGEKEMNPSMAESMCSLKFIKKNSLKTKNVHTHFLVHDDCLSLYFRTHFPKRKYQ